LLAVETWAREAVTRRLSDDEELRELLAGHDGLFEAIGVGHERLRR
jgi:hypothetical protein